jgi:thiol-disulfide isomerase/thioredoxin
MNKISMNLSFANIKRELCMVLFLIISAFNLNAQGNYELSGSLPTEVTSVQIYFDRNFLHSKADVMTVPVKDGKFQVSLTLDRDRMVQLPLYASPGDKIVVNISNDNGFKISLQGTGANENLFLQNFFSKFAGDFNDSVAQKQMLSASIDAFENLAFNRRKKQLDYINSDSSFAGLSTGLKTFIENQVQYRYWQELISYPVINANSSQQLLKVNPLPDIMLDNFSKVKINNEAALISDSYREFIKYYIIYETSKANGFNKFTDLSVSADRKLAVAKEKLSGEVFTYWLSRFSIEECERLSPFAVKKLLGELKEADKNKIYYPLVEAYCGQHTNTQGGKAAAPQNTSTELDLTDLNGKPVSLSSFKGKVVYIDFWASWCGPCRAMMPFSKKLHDELSPKEKKQIVFLYISIDANPDAWRKGITDMSIEGVNVISPGNWSSKACAYFQINSIPRYMIMDKKGEIVDFNAKRPADPAIKQDLLKYSQQ